MSRIGKQSIIVPNGVEVDIKDRSIKVKGPKGELSYTLPYFINAEFKDGQITIRREGDEKETKSAHGLARSLINNMVTGVSKGFEKKLEIIGVGYRAQAAGSKITLHLGFSHPIEYHAIPGVNIEMDKNEKNTIIVSGISAQAVGEVAANIRKFRPPEPYKGKGIRYTGEYVPRKAGKAAGKASS